MIEKEKAVSTKKKNSRIFNQDMVQAFLSLAAVVVISLVAGTILGKNVNHLKDLPGLFLMLTAAKALKGNIFGAMASRLGTSIHSGTYKLSLLPGSVMGQNIILSLVQTFMTALFLGLVAKIMAIAFQIPNHISLSKFIFVSIMGALMASLLVLVVTIAATAFSVRFRLNPDNVTTPLVSSIGDMLTLITMLWAAFLLDEGLLLDILTIFLSIFTIVAATYLWVSKKLKLVSLMNQATPVLLGAILIDLFAGSLLEQDLEKFSDYPVLLMLIPAYLAVAGSLGSILSSRLSTKLHLGLLAPSTLPSRNSYRDIADIFYLAIPTFVVTIVSVVGFGSLLGFHTPGLGQLMGIGIVSGMIIMIAVVAVAYYATTVSVRLGGDPDTYGIPFVNSSMDFVGVFTLLPIVQLFGVS